MIKKIGMGGGCHWCTEAVFQSLKGVKNVEQGYIASTGEASSFSEGIPINFDPEIIPLETLVEIHLLTHRSTSSHSFRKKYRSAIYIIDPEDGLPARTALRKFQGEADAAIVTEVLPFSKFKPSRPALRDYYFSDPEKPFCTRHIEPKIQLLLKRFRKEINLQKFDENPKSSEAPED